MNIYHKLDQFIKSARFVLEYRDFQKQADLNFHVAPGLNYRVNPGAGNQNARQFYNRVKPGFNPKTTKHKSHSRYSSPHVRPNPKPQRPQDSSGYKEWCQLMDRCSSKEDLQEMQQRAPMLLAAFKNDPVMYRKALDFGMRTAVRNFNKYNGTNYSWGNGKLNLSNTTTNFDGRPTTTAPTTNSSAVRSTNPVSSRSPKDIWGSVNPWIQQASPHYENHRNSSNIDLKINASEDVNIISSEIAQVLRQNPNLTIDDALTQLNIAGTALGNDVKNNLTRRLGSFNDFGEEGRAAAGFYQDMQNSQIVQPYNQQTEQYPQQNLQQGSTMNPNSTSSGEYDYLDEMGSGLNRSIAKGKKPALPGMPNTQQQQTRTPPTVATQYGYGAPPSQSGKQPTFRSRPQKPVPTTAQPKVAPTQGWTPAGQPQQQPKKLPVQRYKPTLPMNNGNYQLGTAYTQDEYNTVKSEYYKLREFWESLPEEQKNNPNAQRTYNNMIQQLKTYGNTYQARVAEQANNPAPKTTKTKQWLNPNTGQPDQPQNIPQQQAQPTMPASRSIVPTNNVKPPKPKPEPVQPPATTITTTTNNNNNNNNKLTWHNPNMVSQPTTTSTPQPKPVSDGWVGASVKPTSRSIQPAKKPIVAPPFDSSIDTTFNGAGKEGYGNKPYNGYKTPPAPATTTTMPTNNKPLNGINTNMVQNNGTPSPKPRLKPKPKVPKPDPVSVGLQDQLSKLQQQEATPSSGKLPYSPAEGMNPEARPIGFKDTNYTGGVYDI